MEDLAIDLPAERDQGVVGLAREQIVEVHRLDR